MIYKLIPVLLVSGSLSCNQSAEPEKVTAVKENREASAARDTTTSRDQIVRKAKSEALIAEKGIAVNAKLPYIESEGRTTPRTPREVAQRVVVLAAVNMVAYENFSGPQIIDYLKRYGLWELTTPKEKAFLQNPTPEAKALETWKAEDIWVLMWSLRLVPEIKFPDKPANLNDILPANYPFKGLNNDPAGFIASMSKLRGTAELLDAADLYYRLDWACVDARVNKRNMEKVYPSAVYERHYALNWLIRYLNQDWDDVTCDT